MAAFLIYSQTEVVDPDLFAEYREGFRAMIGNYGGKVIAAAPDLEVLEEDWNSSRVVIVEFTNMEALKRWYGSDEYKPLLELRKRAARGNAIAVNGLE